MFWRRVRSSVVGLTGTWLLWQAAAFVFGLGDVRRHHVEAAAFAFVAAALLTVVLSRPHTEPHADPATRSVPWWAVAGAMTLLVTMVFGPALSAGLFADDFTLLAAAREGRYTTWAELFRPVVFVLWRGVSALPIETATALHALNLVLHAINGTLVVAIGRRLGLGRWAIAAGLLFLVCPALVEPVVWASGIQDVLMTTGVLVVLVIAATSGRSTWQHTVAFVAVVLACLTKETAVAVAPLAMLVECVAHRRVRPTMFTAGIAALVILLVVVRVAWFPVPDDYAAMPTRYELKELLVRPFATLVVPMRATEVDAMPFVALASVTIVVCLIGIASVRWSRSTPAFRAAAGGAVFVLVSLTAVARLFFIDGDLLNSRYLYLGAAGWGICLAALFHAADRWRPFVGRAVFGLFVVGWTLLAAAHVRVWTHAAVERDRVLGAVEAAWTDACGVTSVTGLPETLDGVPLFLNGFPEAMRLRIPAARFHVTPTADAPCRFAWDGAALRAVP